MDLKKAQTMMLDMMKHHNLVGWSFKFDKAVTRLGLCSHRQQRLFLSIHATSVNSEEVVLNTILHEIAHALVGSMHGHDDTWRNKAISIGCNGERCSTIAVKAPIKYTISCNSCNSTIKKLYRVSRKYITDLNRMWCVDCGKGAMGQLVLAEAK